MFLLESAAASFAAFPFVGTTTEDSKATSSIEDGSCNRDCGIVLLRIDESLSHGAANRPTGSVCVPEFLALFPTHRKTL